MLSTWAQRIFASVFLLLSYPALADATVVSQTDEFQYSDSAGGKGRETIRLEAPRMATGECAAFDKAEIVFKKRRYGQAGIVSTPDKGCNPDKGQCKLSVDWEHAPAGRLNYQVKVSWKISSGC